jgi:hypothetical protein
VTRKQLVIIVKAGCLDPEILKNRQAKHMYMNTRHYHQQQLVHQHVSLLQNNYTLNVTLKIKAEEEVSSRCIVDSNLDTISGRKTRISDEIYFLLCQSCFWCASYASPFLYKRMTKETITKCPSCNEENIESLPIAENEKYRFDYDTKRGVTMEFFR